MPLPEAVKHKLSEGERRRENKRGHLEVSFLTNKPFDHESIGIDRTRGEVRTHDAVRPRRLKPSDVAGCRGRFGAGKRILKDPTLSESNMEVGGIEQPAVPETFHLGELILKRCTNDHGLEMAILGQRNQGGRKLAPLAEGITVPSGRFGTMCNRFVNCTRTCLGSACLPVRMIVVSRGVAELDSVSVHLVFWILHFD